MSDQICVLKGEEFHGAQRDIELRGTDNGTLIIAVTTKYGNHINDTSRIGLTFDELQAICDLVNG